MFEFEKEKAKWGLERDWLNTAICELKEKVDWTDEEKERIKKEFDKLKKVKQTAQEKYKMFTGQA